MLMALSIDFIDFVNADFELQLRISQVFMIDNKYYLISCNDAEHNSALSMSRCFVFTIPMTATL